MNITLSELARQSNVNLQTVRYYLRENLIVPDKDEFKKNKFTKEHITQIKFIKQLQSVGFSLNEIDEILKLKVKKNSNCLPIRNKVSKKVNEVASKINQLNEILKLLKTFESKCNGHEKSTECSILEEISHIKS